jgi:hypothetical protein
VFDGDEVKGRRWEIEREEGRCRWAEV